MESPEDPLLYLGRPGVLVTSRKELVLPTPAFTCRSRYQMADAVSCYLNLSMV
jgi:hypothetical protein